LLLSAYQKALHTKALLAKQDAKIRRQIAGWKSAKTLHDISYRSLDMVAQSAVMQGYARSLYSLRKASPSLQRSRCGKGLEKYLTEPYSHLHKEDWIYWPESTDLEKSGLALYHLGKRKWYELNPFAWKTWEAKAMGMKSEEAAAALGYDADDNKVLDRIDLLTLDLKKLSILP
jgi:hypothetical protein